MHKSKWEEIPWLIFPHSQSPSGDFHWFDLTGNQLAMEQENVVCGTFTFDIEHSKGSGGGGIHWRLKIQVNSTSISLPRTSY